MTLGSDHVADLDVAMGLCAHGMCTEIRSMSRT